MSDPRVARMDNFTSTTKSKIPNDLLPGQFVLPAGLTVCIIGAGQEIDLEELAESIRDIDSNIHVLTLCRDVASATPVRDLARSLDTNFGRLEVLICNAGYAGPATLKMDLDQPKLVQRAFDVNAMGTYHAAHYFMPLLLLSGKGAKAFFAVGSMAGCIRCGIIASTGYCVSKLAQIRLIEHLNEQYGTEGLLPLTIHPGAVNTKMDKGNTPEAFIPYLVDDIGLCGATRVWLSMKIRDLSWLSGHLIPANWNMNQLLAGRDEIVEKDLLWWWSKPVHIRILT